MLAIALLFCCCATSHAGDATATFSSRVLPILKTRCAECHGAEKQKAKLDLSQPRTTEQLAADRDLWFRVLEQIESGEMPPEDAKPLSAREKEALTTWIRGDLSKLMLARTQDVGRAKLRRLSRNEYANTVEDLFGIRPVADKHLPNDGRVDGYDNVAAALPLSADGAFGYFTLADDLLKTWVLRPPGKDDQRVVRAAAMESGESAGHILVLDGGTMVSFNSDVTSGRLKFSGTRVAGKHKVRFLVYGYQTDKPLPFGLYAGPVPWELITVLEAPPGKATVVETEVMLRRGAVIRAMPLGIGVQVPKNSQAKNCKGPGLAMQWMEIEGPELPIAGDRWLTADLPVALTEAMRLTKKLTVNGKNATKLVNRSDYLAVMHTTMARVGARLFRRDLTSSELNQQVEAIAQQIDAGVTLDAAFLNQVTELMTSADFLCVIEAPGKLSDFALASRLAYFLWNSTPDEELMQIARSGRLSNASVLREQTERLLNDPRSQRFSRDFVDQWLGLRMINDTTPDARLYPGYGEVLKFSSAQETYGTFRRMLDDDLGVRHLVASPWVLVNDELAKWYGLPSVDGSHLRQVPLPADSPYGGIWTQSAVMKITADGTSTSPVKRGVWVAERLLGTPIPAPPSDIPAVEPDIRGATTLREQLALHSSKGSCATCHAKFDPYGFALESFDVTGAFRTRYREPDGKKWRDGLPVDPSGKVPGGRPFANILDLRAQLVDRPEQLARGLARHLVIYATGAPATAVDQPAIDTLVQTTATNKFGVRSLIHAVVQSELFRWK
ncbi:MAG: DUF1592 domain-containing protein [Planctomycetes bacterium]|nr:DUF1592 domain-containing protein [Planctomycetota bacterium]